jgi:hypothetical protein
MAHYELDEDQRARVQHALAKDEADLKKLKKSNSEEGLDVRDISAKLALLRGDKGGKPGLIQIFSNQTEVFAEPGSDTAQLSIEDALNEPIVIGGNASWAPWVPEPRPAKGDQVLLLDGTTLKVVTDALGFMREGGDGKTPPKDGEEITGVFSAFVVPVDLEGAHTPDDKQKIYLIHSEKDGAWQQVPTPEAAIGELQQAARSGVENFDGAEADYEIVEETPADDQRTVTDLAEFGEHGDSDTPPPVASENGDNSKKPRGRKRAAAGNLAGAVRSEVARATGERKHTPRNSSGKK